MDTFRIENPRVFPYERFPKIAAAQNSFVTQRQVEWMDLDEYSHVNNAIYIDYAAEAAAQHFAARRWSPARLVGANLSIVTRRVHIRYLSVATWGETLKISTHLFDVNDTCGSRYVGMTRLDGSPVAECILDWELVDRKSGAAQPLPDELR